MGYGESGVIPAAVFASLSALCFTGAACSQVLGIEEPLPLFEGAEASDLDAGNRPDAAAGDDAPAGDDVSLDSQPIDPMDASRADDAGAAADDSSVVDAPETGGPRNGPDATVQDSGNPADAHGGALFDVVEASAPTKDAAGTPETSGPTGDPTLVAYWNFDEGAGTAAADSSGHGNVGTLQAGAGWAPGKVGSHCLQLAASGQYVDIAAPVVDTTKPYSVSAWIDFSALGATQTPISIDGNTISGLYFQQRGTTFFSLAMRDSDSTTSNNYFALANQNTTVGAWTYFTGIFDGAQLYIYVNGTLNDSASFSSPWRALGHTAIGRSEFNGYTNYTTASLDEVRFYNRALKASEVQALYLLK